MRYKNFGKLSIYTGSPNYGSCKRPGDTLIDCDWGVESGLPTMRICVFQNCSCSEQPAMALSFRHHLSTSPPALHEEFFQNTSQRWM